MLLMEARASREWHACAQHAGGLRTGAVVEVHHDKVAGGDPALELVLVDRSLGRNLRGHGLLRGVSKNGVGSCNGLESMQRERERERERERQRALTLA
jgi:hypothetical protein